MGFYLNHLKRLDWILIICCISITIFGLGAIWSTGLAKSDFLNFEKQVIFFAIGLTLMFSLSFFDYRILRNNPYLILIFYFLCLIMLAGLYLFAPVIRGTRGWYRFGFFTLDPTEPTKIVLIILLAKYFSMRHVEMYKFRHILISGFYLFFPAVLTFIKPDLGGTLILVLIWLGILMVSGIKINHFLILLLCFISLSVFSWHFLLLDYQKERIISFVLPDNILGGAWSQTQTKISIGSGEIFGKGISQDWQVQYGFLPEPHTDFIFSVIAEEWGLIGVIIFFALYSIIIWRILKIAIQSQSNFPRLFSVGFAIVLITQFAINIGMNLAFLPVVGIYLPFVSYGGSGLIANYLSLGILQSIKVRN